MKKAFVRSEWPAFFSMFRILVIFCALGFIWPQASFAADSNENSNGKSSFYSIGVSSGWVNYLEPGYISFYGVMSGIDGVLQINTQSMFDFRLEGDLLYGNIQYDGQVTDRLGNSAPLKAGANDYMTMFRIKPELDFALGAGFDLVFNAGFGYRYLNDRVNSSSGYQREIAYLFFPLGLRTEYKINTKCSLTFDGEYDFFWYGKVKSHLSDIDPTKPDVTNTQSSSLNFGYRAFLEYQVLIGSIWWGFKPYYQYWSVENSDRAPYVSGQVLIEPKNSSSMGGLIIEARL